MHSVFFYISGHGFGHASRQIEILNALGSAAPAVRLVIRTSAPAWLFQRTMRVPYTLIPGACDTGVVQIDALHLDERATIAAAAAFSLGIEARIAAEVAYLDEHAAALVVADAPPLGLAAASSAGLPGFVVSNFTWDWIYQGYAEHLDQEPDLVPRLGRMYSRAWEGWRLPMYGGFETVPIVRDVPFVARHAGHDRADVRRLLDLPSSAPLVLSSFGGYGVDRIDPHTIDCLDLAHVVLTSPGGPPPALPRGVWWVDESRIYDRDLRYEDLVHAVDVVLTKPGYGIISECIANGTALLYTDRGRFAEYDVLTREMPRYLRCQYIDHRALFAGRWRTAMQRLLASPAPPERPRTDGAHLIAGMVLERM